MTSNFKELTFKISPSYKNDNSFVVENLSNEYEKKQSNRIIIGQFIGCEINGVNYGNDVAKNYQISNEDIILNGSGQFIVISNSEDKLSILTSKNLFPIFWSKNKSGCYLFSNKIEKISNFIDTKITINQDEIMFQTQFYGSAFNTIVNNVQILSWGSRLLIRKNFTEEQTYIYDLIKEKNKVGTVDVISGLNKYINIIKKSGKKVILLLSGGIDSSLLLLLLKENKIKTIPIVLTQKYKNEYSAINEIVESKKIAKLFNEETKILSIDTQSELIFNRGADSGWHWCFSYFVNLQKFAEKNDYIIIDGAGDTFIGLYDTSFSVFNIKNSAKPIASTKKLIRRLQLNNMFLERTYKNKSDSYQFLANFIISSKIPILNKNSTFNNKFIDSTALKNYVENNTLKKLFKNLDHNDIIGKLRILKSYYYFAGRVNGDRFITAPFLDAIPEIYNNPIKFSEIFNGKNELLRYFKLKTGKDFKKYLGNFNNDTYQRIPFIKNKYLLTANSEFENKLNIKNPSFNLKSTNWFYRGLFEKKLNHIISSDVILLDLLDDKLLRKYYEKLLYDLKNNQFEFSKKHQPVEIVKMLKMEIFLRKLFKSDH